MSDFKTLIKRRTQNEPVAYITGEKGFFESDFEVSNHVLIPRPDTETIVEQAIRILDDTRQPALPKTVLELGAGSGAIIVSLAKALPGNRYFAGDISVPALEVARKNSKNIARDRVAFFSGAWFSSLKQKPIFDLIVSNPPYIPTGDINTLQSEVRNFEPRLALDGGRDGLDCFREILNLAHHFLLPGGILLLEMGYDQKEDVSAIFSRQSQYESIVFVKDLAGHDRGVIIKKSID